jgi:hypothetical protein
MKALTEKEKIVSAIIIAIGIAIVIAIIINGLFMWAPWYPGVAIVIMSIVIMIIGMLLGAIFLDSLVQHKNGTTTKAKTKKVIKAIVIVIAVVIWVVIAIIISSLFILIISGLRQPFQWG